LSVHTCFTTHMTSAYPLPILRAGISIYIHIRATNITHHMRRGIPQLRAEGLGHDDRAPAPLPLPGLVLLVFQAAAHKHGVTLADAHRGVLGQVAEQFDGEPLRRAVRPFSLARTDPRGAGDI